MVSPEVIVVSPEVTDGVPEGDLLPVAVVVVSGVPFAYEL